MFTYALQAVHFFFTIAQQSVRCFFLHQWWLYFSVFYNLIDEYLEECNLPFYVDIKVFCFTTFFFQLFGFKSTLTISNDFGLLLAVANCFSSCDCNLLLCVPLCRHQTLLFHYDFLQLFGFKSNRLPSFYDNQIIGQ